MAKGEKAASSSVLHVELIAFFAKRSRDIYHPYKSRSQATSAVLSILFWQEHVELRISLFDQDKL